MTPTQLDAIDQLLGLSDSPVRRAARLVLLSGESQSAAARAEGISQPSVSAAVKRYRDAHAIISEAWPST